MTADPFALFAQWFDEATRSEPSLPDAMTVATANSQGRPSARMCLLKSHGPEGFTFYTNFDSRKGREIAANPRVALLFHWKSLQRQVRIEGDAAPVSAAEADAYFATRSREAQIGAWASDQSRPLASREIFEQRFAELSRRFEGQQVTRPPSWCGYRIVPEVVEFWTERPYRLHERRLFTRHGSGWREELLYP